MSRWHHDAYCGSSNFFLRGIKLCCVRRCNLLLQIHSQNIFIDPKSWRFFCLNVCDVSRLSVVQYQGPPISLPFIFSAHSVIKFASLSGKRTNVMLEVLPKNPKNKCTALLICESNDSSQVQLHNKSGNFCMSSMWRTCQSSNYDGNTPVILTQWWPNMSDDGIPLPAEQIRSRELDNAVHSQFLLACFITYI